MAAAHQTSNTLRGDPLYIFYDCEATGLDIKTERIIEVGAVLCTYNLNPMTAQPLQQDNCFTSLCYCTHPINPESAKVLTITLQDLRGAPRLEEVLKKFCHWIKEKVSTAESCERKTYTPVLVAHSGNLLDFPLLFNEINRTGSYELKQKFEELNLQYADSYTTVRQLARTNYFYRGISGGLGVKNLHQGLLHRPYDGHRALPDAQALHNIFTQSNSIRQLELFGQLRKLIQSKQTVEFLREQIPKFQEAHINPAKAEQLLSKGITYENIRREYQNSPRTFQWYLTNICGITKPREELLDHFKFC